MPKPVPLDRLAGELAAILKDYEGDVTAGTAEAVQKAAKTAQQALRKVSPKGATGDYARSWRVEIERSPAFTVATVYSTKPGLPHLLEFGHVSKNGTGRTFGDVKAIPHIEPVEKQVVEDFEKAIREVIEK